MKLKDYPKIINLKQLEEIKKIIDRKNLKISFANGCFDLIHSGHIRYLKASKEMADLLFVGVNDDISIKKLKGEKRPIFPLQERLEILSSIIYIDFLIPFSEEKPIKIIEILKPNFHCKGADYTPSSVPEKEIVEKYGGKVLIVTKDKEPNTTSILKRLKE